MSWVVINHSLKPSAKDTYCASVQIGQIRKESFSAFKGFKICGRDQVYKQQSKEGHPETWTSRKQKRAKVLVFIGGVFARAGKGVCIIWAP